MKKLTTTLLTATLVLIGLFVVQPEVAIAGNGLAPRAEPGRLVLRL